MAISHFLNFAFLPQKIQNIFLKNDHKILSSSYIQKFQKTGIYVVELAVLNQCAKFQLDTIIFDPQKGCFCLPHSAQ